MIMEKRVNQLLILLVFYIIILSCYAHVIYCTLHYKADWLILFLGIISEGFAMKYKKDNNITLKK